MKKNGLQIITRRMVIFNTPCCIWQLVAQVEKPRDFDPFGHAGLSPLVTI